MWKITSETDSFLYAVDINHKNERHLNGCGTLLDAIKSPPSVFITDCITAMRRDPVKKPDVDIITAALERLQNGGNVLFPVDSAGRVLELLAIFHDYWAEDERRANSRGRLAVYQLVFVHPVAASTINFARSNIDWMNYKLSEDAHKGSNPFEFKTDRNIDTIKICESLEQVDALPSNFPKIIFASDDSLETGFAKELLLRFANDSRNLLLLTSWSYPGSLAHSIVNNPTQRVWPIKVYRKVPLTGQELEDYILNEEREKARELEEAKNGVEEDEQMELEDEGI